MEGNSVDITVFYINKLESLPLTIDEKKRLEESFTIIKDWFVYLDYDAIDTGKSSTKQSWAPCAHRDCLDCCMYRKLQELESSNIVQKTWFVITAAWSTAEMASVCGYDCLFG